MIRLPLFVLALPLLISLIHPYSSHAQDERSSGDPIVIKLIQLDYADAKELASVLAPLLSEEGRIVPYQSANSLIIKDRASVVRGLVEIIKGKAEGQSQPR